MLHCPQIPRLRAPAARFARDDVLAGLVGRARHHVISDLGFWICFDLRAECRARVSAGTARGRWTGLAVLRGQAIEAKGGVGAHEMAAGEDHHEHRAKGYRGGDHEHHHDLIGDRLEGR
jgi:hypothetical protein